MSATRNEATAISQGIYQMAGIQTYALYPKTVLENVRLKANQ